MAIPGYTPGVEFPPGDCVPTGKFIQMLRNVKAFAKHAATVGAEVTCDPVEEVLTGPIDEDLCVVIRDKTFTAATNETKVLLVSALFDTEVRVTEGSGENYTVSNTGADPDSANNDPTVAIAVAGNGSIPTPTAENIVTILCDDVPVWEGVASETMSAEFDCPKNSEIKLCARAVVQGNLPGQAPTGTTTIRFCGALICKTPFVAGSISTLWCPPCSLSIVCKPGREILHLLYQQILGFCRYFQRGGQTQDYFAYQFQDQVEHNLITNISNPSTYVLMGQVTVCARATSFAGAQRSFVVRPYVGCQSSRTNCNAKGHNFVRDENDADSQSVDEVCLTVKFYVCGRCQPGETLAAGFNFADLCEGNNPFGGNVEIIHAEQEYCVYLFEEIPIPALGSFQRPDANCITSDTLNGLVEKMELTEQAVCDQNPIVPDFDESTKVLGNNQESTLFAAVTLPVPPPTPLPVPWPPVRIVNYEFTFQFCLESTSPTIPLEDPLIAFGYIEILCGGNPIKAITPPNPDDVQFSWLVADSGQYFRCSDVFCQLCCNIQCPIDQPLTIRPVITTPGFSPGAWAVELTCKRLGF